MTIRGWRLRSIFKRFHELHELSLQDQQLVLDRSTKRGVRRSVIVSSLVALGALIPGVFAGFFVATFASLAAGVVASALPNAGLEWLAVVVWLLAFALTVSVIVVVAVEWVEQSAIRRELRGQLNRAECVKCGYSLAGLTPIDGRVTCPECGLNVRVQVYAWNREPPKHPPTESGGSARRAESS